jgi:hypothetical protein
MKLSFTQKRLLPLVAMPPIKMATNGKNARGLDERAGVHLYRKRVTFLERAGDGLAACAQLNHDDITVNAFTAASHERTKAMCSGANVLNGVILETVPRC